MSSEATIQIVNPFTDIVPPDYAYNAAGQTDFEQFSMGGGGANGLKADAQGLWFGSRTFATAPFKVDMSGNMTVASLVITGGTVKYGKTAFSDSVHAGYYIGNEGVYIGGATDATKLKFTVASGLLDLVGTVSGRSTDILAAAINASGLATGIVDGLVTTLKIADGQVTSAKTSIAAINPTSGEINANKVGTTQIDTSAVTAAKIASGAVTANKLTTYNFVLSAGAFSNNSPSSGRIAWSSCKVVYNGTEYTITNGSCLSTNKHVYWQLSNPTVFSASDTLPALGNDDFLVAFNSSGTALLVWNSTIVNGNRITTGSISATQIAAHAITANEIAASTITANEIAAATITAAKMNVSQLSAISADLGTITAGTVTGALIQTSSSSYTGVKMSSGIGGIAVYGQNFNLYDTSGTLYGYVGGYGGYYNIYANNRNILIDAGGATIHCNSNVAPLSHAGAQLGYYNYAWANVYALNFAFNNSQYFNTNGSYIQSNSDFRVSGSIALTGNMVFENYASLTIKDSGGTSRTLTCQYNSTLGRYILST